MKTCDCGTAEETVIAVGYRNDRGSARPVKVHVEDATRYNPARLFLLNDEGRDYVKKQNGTQYGFNVAREIAGLAPGHSGMTADEEIVIYLNGNTLDLRRCNLQVQLASDKRARPGKYQRDEKPVEYGSTEHISTFETPKRRNSAAELWNQQVGAK